MTPKSIPAFIINRNLLAWPKKMVEWMSNIPEIEPIIFDNASTYPPLLEWYDSGNIKVIRIVAEDGITPVNTGHAGIFYSGILEQIPNQYYIVADPDFDMTSVPFDVIEKMKEGLKKYPTFGKCGLAIHIDDIPYEFPGRQFIIDWESKYWNDPLDSEFYRAHVDTTFALYEKDKVTHHTYEAIRLAGKYTARHIPWYITPHSVTEEFVYYCEHNEGPANICFYCQDIINNYKNSKQL